MRTAIVPRTLLTMPATVVTLFEGHYHLGAAALINSLHANGFTGTVVCGYRGPLPPWHTRVDRVTGVSVRFREITSKTHFTNYKPQFMEECWREVTPEADLMYYSDPDIVVKAPWTMIERWARGGVALSEDLNAYLPSGHPYRLQWLEFLSSHHVAPVRALERYYNAGFIGVDRVHRSVLGHWLHVLELATRTLGPLDRIKNGGPNELFHTIDQDALNMALLLGTEPIHGAGPESMDFIPGGHLLSHAAGGVKPWRGGFLGDALKGRPPGLAQKNFYAYASSPLEVFDPGTLKKRQRELSLAAAIGRFYRRS